MAQYRIVNGRKFKVTVVPTEYTPSKVMVNVRPGIKISNGKVDPTMVPSTHR